MSQIFGIPGNDTLRGTNANDLIDGDTGNNFIFASAGNDTITGGSRGQSGADFNQITYREATGPIRVVLGSSDGSRLDGQVSGDASVGNDTLIRIDQVQGSQFDDTFIVHSNWRGGQFDAFGGGARGQWNSWRLSPGDDTIIGNGFTRLSAVDATAGLLVQFDPVVMYKGVVEGDDARLGVDNFTGVNNIDGSRFDDRMIGGPGDEVFRPRGGNDVVDGGGGINRIDYSLSAEGVQVDLRKTGPQLISASEGLDTLVNIQQVVGSGFNDVIVGDRNANTLFGGSGDDLLDAGPGGRNSWLEGGPGNDTLIGAASNNPDNDVTFASYAKSTGSVLVRLHGGSVPSAGTVSGNASVGTDTLRGIDFVVGSRFSDEFRVDQAWVGPGRLNFDLENMFSKDFKPWLTQGLWNDFRPNSGNDSIFGNGHTRLTYRFDSVDQSAAIQVQFSADRSGTVSGKATDGTSFTDTFQGVSSIRGTTGNDLMRGGSVLRCFYLKRAMTP